MYTIYGLSNCDSCRKAMLELRGDGPPPVLVNIREDTDLQAKVPAWLDAAGAEALVNTRSTTWKGLSDADKAAARAGDAAVLIANPTLMKRPVIETDDGRVLVGWGPDVRAALGVE